MSSFPEYRRAGFVRRRTRDAFTGSQAHFAPGRKWGPVPFSIEKYCRVTERYRRFTKWIAVVSSSGPSKLVRYLDLPVDAALTTLAQRLPNVLDETGKHGRLQASTRCNAVSLAQKSGGKYEDDSDPFRVILSGKHRIGAKCSWLGSRSRSRLQNGSR